jgi:hypothetical protein
MGFPRGGGAWEADVEVDAGSLLPDDFWREWGKDPRNEFVQGPVWWSASAKGVNGAPFPLSFSAFNSIKLTDFKATGAPGGRTFTYTSSSGGEPSPNVGDKLSAIVRLGYTWHTHNSTSCTTVNVTINTASFMAVTEFNGRGGHTYDGVRESTTLFANRDLAENIVLLRRTITVCKQRFAWF